MNITVVGTHKLSTKPERGTLRLSAGFETDDSEQTLRATTALVNELHAELEALKQRSPHAVTWFAVLPFRTRSWRPYHDKGKVLPMRYSATAELRAKFRDFAVLSRVAAEMGRREGVTLNGVEWTLTEVTRARVDSDVTAGAVRRAHERGMVMAKAAGATSLVAIDIADPGLLSEVSGKELGRHDAMVAMREAIPEPGDIDLVPEDVVVQAEVHVRFQAL